MGGGVGEGWRRGVERTGPCRLGRVRGEAGVLGAGASGGVPKRRQGVRELWRDQGTLAQGLVGSQARTWDIAEGC